MMRKAYLLMVTADNHNKFYEMREEAGCLAVRYGRVGAKGVLKAYPMSSWDRLYRSKVQKGYRDMTGLHAAADTVDDGASGIKDKEVAKLFGDLLRWSNQSLRRNYTVDFKDVTPQMIGEAERLLRSLKYQDASAANQTLLKLYATVPRKMGAVSDFLVKDKDGIAKAAAREYEVLDVMRARVSGSPSVKTGDDPLKKLGLEITEVTDGKRLSQIKKHLGETGKHFRCAYRVRNHATDRRFMETMEKGGYGSRDVHYLYHGSRNQNWYGLITQGPLLRPAAPINGKMFGEGLYFAPKARKSLGYTSLRGSCWANGTEKQGYMAVYKVLYRNERDLYDAAPHLNSTNVRPNDAVYAHAGRALFNDEVIVYKEGQVTLQYLIKLAA